MFLIFYGLAHALYKEINKLLSKMKEKLKDEAIASSLFSTPQNNLYANFMLKFINFCC